MKNNRFTSVEFIGGLPHGGDVNLGTLDLRGGSWAATPGDTFGDPWEVLGSIGEDLARRESATPVPTEIGSAHFTVVIKRGKLSASFEVTGNKTLVNKKQIESNLSAEDEQAARQFLLKLPGIIVEVLGTYPQGTKTEGTCSCCMQWKEIDVFTRECSTCSASGRCG